VRPFLLLVLLALGGALVLQWRDWPPPAVSEQQDRGEANQVPAPAPAVESPLELLAPPEAKEEFAVIVERPLFMPTRRPPQAEPDDPEEPPPEDTSLDRMDLNAVIITPSKRIAWVRDPGKKELVDLEPGDDFNGWTVKEIRNDRLVLERQGEQDTLTLRDYKNMPPPAPRRPQSAAQKKPPAGAADRNATDQRRAAARGQRPQSAAGGQPQGAAQERGARRRPVSPSRQRVRSPRTRTDAQRPR
jgi:hypothetical protein